jgi:hypothetical protein
MNEEIKEMLDKLTPQQQIKVGMILQSYDDEIREISEKRSDITIGIILTNQDT